MRNIENILATATAYIPTLCQNALIFKCKYYRPVSDHRYVWKCVMRSVYPDPASIVSRRAGLASRLFVHEGRGHCGVPETSDPAGYSHQNTQYGGKNSKKKLPMMLL